MGWFSPTVAPKTDEAFMTASPISANGSPGMATIVPPLLHETGSGPVEIWAMKPVCLTDRSWLHAQLVIMQLDRP